MSKPHLNTQELETRLEGQTAPRVTKDGIEARIKDVKYTSRETLTVCIIEMVNGFIVVGHSACASPENYDEQIGQTLAYDNAFAKLWALEGYLLRERLWWESQHPTAAESEGQEPAGEEQAA